MAQEIDDNPSGELHQFTTIEADLSDDVIRDVRRRARSLSPDDERVTDHTGGLVSVSETMLSTLLFRAGPDTSHLIPHTRHDWESGTICLRFSEPAEFPEGDGFVTVEIEADHPTHEIEEMIVSAELWP